MTISEEKQRVLWGKQNQAKKGSLGLPELLDNRRLEHGIVDGAFASRAVFDRVFVWQLPMESSETYEGTCIVKTEITKRREHEEAPRGIIVSMGLKAADTLKSNGIDVGHIVSFVRLAPYRKPCGRGYRANEEYVIILRDGDVISSEDLEASLRAGLVEEKYAAAEKQHFYAGRGLPQVPEMSTDY